MFVGMIAAIIIASCIISLMIYYTGCVENEFDEDYYTKFDE